MKEKYILIKPFTCQYGTLPINTEIIYFNNQFFVNGGPIPNGYNDLFFDLIADGAYVIKEKIIPNKV